jgi:hypothetical protein
MLIQEIANGHELWLIAQWADPSWQAQISNNQGQWQPAPIISLAGGWQAVEVPGPGQWRLELTYKPASATLGMRISAISWTIFIIGMLYLKLFRPSAN